MFDNPWPGEDGTPDVPGSRGAEARTTIPADVKAGLMRRVEQNAAKVAARGMGLHVQAFAGTSEGLADSPAQTVDENLVDERLARDARNYAETLAKMAGQSPVTSGEVKLPLPEVPISVHVDTGYGIPPSPVQNVSKRGSKPRGNRAGKKVQKSRQSKAQKAASQFVAEARSLDRTTKRVDKSPEF